MVRYIANLSILKQNLTQKGLERKTTSLPATIAQLFRIKRFILGFKVIIIV